MSFSSCTIRWRAREKCNKGCFGFDQLYGIDWKEHYTRVPELFLYFLRSSYCSECSCKLTWWPYISRHYISGINLTITTPLGLTMASNMVSYIPRSLCSNRSRATACFALSPIWQNKYTLVGDTAGSGNSFASEVEGGGSAQSHSYRTHASEANVATYMYAFWVVYLAR